VLMRDLGRGPVLFHHDSRGKEKQCSLNPQNISFSLSFFRHKEGDEKTMTDCSRGCKGAQGRPYAFIALRCHSRGGEATDP
jgi:hypothetical protein